MEKNYSNFAQKQLEKYGWKEGNGLGKTSLGISEPIKATFKYDLTGLGYDHSSQFDDKCWSDLYMDASTRLSVNEEGTQIITETESNNKIGRRNDKLYKSFNLGGTLDNGVESNLDMKQSINKNSIKSLKVLKKSTKKSKSRKKSKQSNCVLESISDADLYEFCRGRTCHPASRFGLTGGKLKRIEIQNMQLGSSKL